MWTVDADFDKNGWKHQELGVVWSTFATEINNNREEASRLGVDSLSSYAVLLGGIEARLVYMTEMPHAACFPVRNEFAVSFASLPTIIVVCTRGLQ